MTKIDMLMKHNNQHKMLSWDWSTRL